MKRVWMPGRFTLRLDFHVWSANLTNNSVPFAFTSGVLVDGDRIIYNLGSVFRESFMNKSSVLPHVCWPVASSFSVSFRRAVIAAKYWYFKKLFCRHQKPRSILARCRLGLM